jgi:hypothetical protein
MVLFSSLDHLVVPLLTHQVLPPSFGGQFSWFSYQESIGLCHSFDTLSLYFLFTYLILVVLGAFCLGCPTLSL